METKVFDGVGALVRSVMWQTINQGMMNDFMHGVKLLQAIPMIMNVQSTKTDSHSNPRMLVISCGHKNQQSFDPITSAHRRVYTTGITDHFQFNLPDSRDRGSLL